MINSVRNTVLAVLNKNNYGYLSPQDFNLYCLQAQMDLFEDYFYQYNNWINRENNRSSGSGYADIIKGLEEVIDTFSVPNLIAAIPLSSIGFSAHAEKMTGKEVRFIALLGVILTPVPDLRQVQVFSLRCWPGR